MSLRCTSLNELLSQTFSKMKNFSYLSSELKHVYFCFKYVPLSTRVAHLKQPENVNGQIELTDINKPHLSLYIPERTHLQCAIRRCGCLYIYIINMRQNFFRLLLRGYMLMDLSVINNRI